MACSDAPERKRVGVVMPRTQPVDGERGGVTPAEGERQDLMVRPAPDKEVGLRVMRGQEETRIPCRTQARGRDRVRPRGGGGGGVLGGPAGPQARGCTLGARGWG